MKKLLVICCSLFLFSSCAKKEEALRVGMDLSYPPFETLIDGEAAGISVDIANALGEYLNREVIIVNTSFASLIPALQTEDIDVVIGSMSITNEREQFVDFTNPYMYFKIIGLANNDYLTTNNLTKDSLMEDIFQVKNTKFVGIASQVSATIPESKGFSVLEMPDPAGAILELTQGNADLFLMSPSPIVRAHNANLQTTTIIWDPSSINSIGMAVNNGNQELLDELNAFIATMATDVYPELITKYEVQMHELLGENRGLEFYLNDE